MCSSSCGYGSDYLTLNLCILQAALDYSFKQLVTFADIEDEEPRSGTRRARDGESATKAPTSSSSSLSSTLSSSSTTTASSPRGHTQVQFLSACGSSLFLSHIFSDCLLLRLDIMSLVWSVFFFFFFFFHTQYL